MSKWGHSRRNGAIVTLAECPLCSDSVQALALQRNIARCQCTKSLCDSGEVRLDPSIIPREEIAGSTGSGLS